MSLNWNIEKVKGREDFTPEQFQLVDHMIWFTMSVGIHTVTEKNTKEFLARIQLLENLFGALMSDKDGPKVLTLEDVEMCIGLTTNASSMTRNQFNKVQIERFYKQRGV